MRPWISPHQSRGTPGGTVAVGKAMLEQGLSWKASWPLEKATLVQVPLKVTAPVDKSVPQQVQPWRDSGASIRLHLEQVQP